MTDQSQQDGLPFPPIPWWQSRTIWWALITAVCNFMAILSQEMPPLYREWIMNIISPEHQKWLIELILNGAGIITVGMTIYYRVHTTARISKKDPNSIPNP